MPSQDEREIFELLGRIAAQWNDIEEQWYSIFGSLMPPMPWRVLEAIYNQFQTGAMKRQLVLAVGDASLSKDHPTLREEMGRLYAKTNNLAGDRNAVVHSVYGDKRGKLRAVRPKSRHKPFRLANKDLLNEFVRVLADIQTLDSELWQLSRELAVIRERRHALSRKLFREYLDTVAPRQNPED